MISRRRFIKNSAGAGLAFTASGSFSGCSMENRNIEPMEIPVIESLSVLFKEPFILKDIQLISRDGNLFVRIVCQNGHTGIIQGNTRILNTLTLFKTLVAPFFLKKDCREIVDLIEQVGRHPSCYKFAGMPFWNAVAHIELCILDMLGKAANKPVAGLFGEIRRKEVDIYLSSLRRDTTPEQEVGWIGQRLAETNSRAVKLKIGGRMSLNQDAMPGRTEELVPLARKTFGDSVALYFDSNGSYDVPKAITTGRLLEEYGAGFFEEPVPWQDFDGTKMVADQLSMTIAGGEQDSNLFLFRHMLQQRAYELVQPDLFYNGGFIRCLQVARMAAACGINITPHSPKNDASGAANLQFASLVENLGPHQEFNAQVAKRTAWYTPYPEVVNGKVNVPEGNGLGMEFDPEYILGGEIL